MKIVQTHESFDHLWNTNESVFETWEISVPPIDSPFTYNFCDLNQL